MCKTPDPAFSCWHCQSEIEYGALFCDSCHKIQPVTELDHFTRLSLPKGFKLDEAALQRTYLQAQQQLHPDRYVQASPQEQNIALEQSMLVNQAYALLKDPRTRAEYLLSLDGVIVNTEKDTYKPDFTILEEEMERRDTLAETTDLPAITALEDSAKSEYEAALTTFEGHYIKQELKPAAQAVIRLRYIGKFLDDIRRHKRRAF